MSVAAWAGLAVQQDSTDGEYAGSEDRARKLHGTLDSGRIPATVREFGCPECSRAAIQKILKIACRMSSRPSLANLKVPVHAPVVEGHDELAAGPRPRRTRLPEVPVGTLTLTYCRGCEATSAVVGCRSGGGGHVQADARIPGFRSRGCPVPITPDLEPDRDDRARELRVHVGVERSRNPVNGHVVGGAGRGLPIANGENELVVPHTLPVLDELVMSTHAPDT